MLGKIIFGAKKAKPSICKKAFTFCTREMFAAGLGMGAQKHHASFFQIEMRLILCMLFFLSVFFSERVCLNLCAFCYQTISSTTKNFFPSVSKQIRSQYTQSEKNITFFGTIWLAWTWKLNHNALLYIILQISTQLMCKEGAGVNFEKSLEDGEWRRKCHSGFTAASTRLGSL